jgi:hypothetical protein
MTNVTAVAQAKPILALTTRLGELKDEADRRIADLELTLRHIDETKQLLNEHGLTMVVDLGPVGNAAAHARTAAVADAQTERFSLPGRAA